MTQPASQTLDYNNANAQAFAASTVSVDFSATQRRFAKLLPPGARMNCLPFLGHEKWEAPLWEWSYMTSS